VCLHLNSIGEDMHIYVGWICQTPGCGDEIPYQYLGEEPLRDKIEIKIPALVIVKCRTCGQVHNYAGKRPLNLRYATRLPPDHETN
jgi:hypothetical protein